jgi:hypothetical protein
MAQDRGSGEVGVTGTSTPVYDNVESDVRTGAPRDGGGIPRHPDIYIELCNEWGHDPRRDDVVVPEQRRAEGHPQAGPAVPPQRSS